MTRHHALCTALGAVIFVHLLANCARGQSAAPSPAGGETEEDRLAHEVNDPTAILTQFKIQDLYTPHNFQTSAQTNTIQLRPVIPIRAFSFLPMEQLIRPTFKIATLATSRSSSTITEFGDMELFDLFASRWPDPKATEFGWGVGPTFVFPTGRDSDGGSHAWQVGPAAAAKYVGIPHLMIGFLFQNPISFAYTKRSASPRNQMQFQPLISYTLGHGFYVKSADSTWTVNWRHHTSTTIPVSFGIGRVWKFPGPDLDTWVSGEWMAYRQYTGITPMYTIRFGLTLLFPNFAL